MRLNIWLMTVVLAVSACGGEGVVSPPPSPPLPEPAVVEIRPSAVELDRPGSADTLTATVRDSNGNALSNLSVEWRSSDAGVVSVSDDGVVSAVNSGSAVVSARVGSRPSVAGSVTVKSFAPRVSVDIVVNDGLDTAWVFDYRRPLENKQRRQLLVPVVAVSQYGDSMSVVPTVTTVNDNVEGVVFEPRAGGVLFEADFKIRDEPLVEDFVIRAETVADTITVIVRTLSDAVYKGVDVFGLQLESGQTWVYDGNLDNWFASQFDEPFEYDVIKVRITSDDNADAASSGFVDGVWSVTGIESGSVWFGVVATNRFEQSFEIINVVVDYCYEPPTRYNRASPTASFRVELRFHGDYSNCFRQLANDALALFEAALAPTTFPPIPPHAYRSVPTDGYDMVIDFRYDDCYGTALAGPEGDIVELNNGGVLIPGGVVLFCGGPKRIEGWNDEGWIPRERAYRLLLHELGHVFGIGTYWRLRGYDRFPRLSNESEGGGSTVDTHFAGRRTVAAFDELGGTTYLWGKVPVMNASGGANGHWRGHCRNAEDIGAAPVICSGSVVDRHPGDTVMCGEVMSYCRLENRTTGEEFDNLSAITLAALEDFGWRVDYSVAEPFMVDMMGSADGAQWEIHDKSWMLTDDVLPWVGNR